MDERQIISSIETELLDIANLYNECTTSDLQGIATAKAHTIYDLLKKELKKDDRKLGKKI